MQSDSLVLPLVFEARGQGPIVEQACAAALPSKLISWGLDIEHEGDVGIASAVGAAMGCEDGSIFIFCADMATNGVVHTIPFNESSGNHAATTLHAPLTSHVSREPSPSPSPTSSLKFPTHSRTASNSNHVPHPLSQPTRSRITSFVSKASAEAPKNYVDFDDEKNKLEGILKGGPAVKEKSITDGLRASYGIAGLGIPGETDGGSHRKKRLSYTGSTPSTAGTPRDSLSSPPSPSSPSSVSSPLPPLGSRHPSHVGVAPPLIPKFHVFPPRFRPRNKIISLRHLTSGILLALQESGMITVVSTHSGHCLATIDLESTPHLHPPPSPSPSVFLATTGGHSVWTWKHLHVVEASECTILLAVASDQASATSDGDLESRSRVTILQLQNPSHFLSSMDSSAASRSGVLQKVAEWLMNGVPEAVGLLAEPRDDTSSARLFYVTPAPNSTLVAHSLKVVPPAFVVAAPLSLQPSPDAISSSSVTPVVASTSLPNLSLSIPNPFKPKSQSRPSDKDHNKSAETVPGRVILGPALTLGQVPILQGDRGAKGMQIWTKNNECMQGALWNHRDFVVFETTATDTEPRVLGKASHHGLATVERLETDIFMLVETHKVDSFRLPRIQDSLASSQRFEHLSSISFTRPCSVAAVISPSLVLCCRTRSNSTGLNNQRLIYAPLTSMSSKFRQGNKPRDEKQKTRTAWSYFQEKRSNEEEGGVHRLTSILPIDLDLIILGYSDGSLNQSSLTNLLTTGWPTYSEKAACANGVITSLHSLKNERTGEKLVVAGVDDGSITVWDLSTLQLRAQWTIFTTPLLTVIPLEEEDIGRLRGCIVCVSNDGTLAVIAVDGLEFLFLIPGSAARLTRICLGEDNLLLVYADGKARLWDVKTQEFWRSMTSKTADELLRQGGWFETEVGHGEADLRGMTLTSLQKCFSSYDAASTLLLDIRALSDLIHPFPSSHLFRDPRLPESPLVRQGGATQLDARLPTKRVSRRLKFLKALLGSLLSFGLDDRIDEICKEKLAIAPSMASVGLSGTDMATSLFNTSVAREAWQISSEYTASRLLTLVTILRGLLVFDECEQYANQVIAFYTASLRDAVGPLWQAPSLSFLARYWFHPSTDIRLAARALFGAAADRLSDEDTIQLVEHWQHESVNALAVPCLQPDAEKQSTYSALALLIAGNVATDRYAVFSASTLTDIAKSITLYLHDEDCPHRILAIDLCSRGFQIWQHYVDAMEVLRALFSLSTSAEKERNAGPQARMAVLQIASSNTPLFMTTLSLDILHPRSVQQRKSIMQLVAFLIRKKPLVLYPNLPRLVEAVVKSLDPGSSGDRDAVFDAATEILGQVVKTFPSVDFHMQSQRLCVGTSEGAVIMYDLKTATRLYVLEGHKKRLSACSFSPDGRRLATVSLEESIVRIWKVGSSLTSLFMPGAPPRQGHSGSEPYKTLNFNVGNEANMTVAVTLEWVQFEWPTDRTARLKIRDSAFTFNT